MTNRKKINTTEPDLSNMLLKIDINATKWKSFNTIEKIKYLKEKIITDDNKQSLSVISSITNTVCSLVKSNTTSNILRDYMNIIETGVGLFSTSMILNNMFVSKTVEIKHEYDKIAHMMNIKSGIHVTPFDIKVTAEMCKLFCQMPHDIQTKYDIEFINIEYNDSTDDILDSNGIHTVNIVFKYMNIIIGSEIQYLINKANNNGQESYSTFVLLFSTVDSTDILMNIDDITNNIQKLIYTYYLSTIDITSNYIAIKNSNISILPRQEIKINIHNFDIDSTVSLMKKVLKNKYRRGYTFMGDPGTGKTVSIHKIMMNFLDIPIFWISSDSLINSEKIRAVFRILNMFPGSIFIFDDLDGLDMSYKSQITTTFIECIDETNSSMFNGIIIMAINDPKRIHQTILNRPGRNDEIIFIENPKTIDSVLDIIVQRFYLSNINVPDWININNTDFCASAKNIIDNMLTHAHISTIIDDILHYDKDNLTIDVLNDGINKRIKSIENATLSVINGHIQKSKSNDLLLNTTGSIKNDAFL